MKHLIAGVLCVGLCACGSSSKKNGGSSEVGLILPKTGSIASAYDSLGGSSTLAAKLITDGGGLLGGDVSYVERDEAPGTNGTAPAEAVCNEFATLGFGAFLGPSESTDAIACASIAGAASKVEMAAAAGAVGLTTANDNDFAFRMVATTALVGSATAQVSWNRNVRHAGVLTLDNANSHTQANAFKAAFTAAGGTITEEVYTYDSTNPSAFDAAGHLQAVFSTNPGVVFLAGFPPDAEALLQAWNSGPAALAYSNGWILSSALLSESIATNVGVAKMQGIEVGTPHQITGDALTAIDTVYTQVNGFSLTTFNTVVTLAFFDGAVVTLLAIEKAGTSTDGAAIRQAMREVADPPGTKITWDTLKDGIDAIHRGEDIDYDGSDTSSDFDANGDVPGAVDIFKFDAGGHLGSELTLEPGVDFTP